MLQNEINLLNVFSDYRKTQLFGKTQYAIDHPGYYPPGGHTGIDFGMKQGTPIRATHNGVIVQDHDIDRSGKGIYIVIIDPVQLVATHYYHMVNNCVRDRQAIKAGQLIGWSGNTGLSDGAHLHFGLCRIDNEWMRIDKDNEYNGFIDPLGENVRWLNV